MNFFCKGDGMKKTFFFLIALIGTLLCSVPIFAFETTEVDPTIISWYNGSPYSWQVYPDANQHVRFDTTRSLLGFELGIPIPYYSDGDHYSLFCSFTFECETSLLTQGIYAFYVFPYNVFPSMSLVDSGMELFRINPPSYTSTSQSGVKTFTWYYDRSCSCKYLIYTGASDTAHTAVSVYMVMDLNLDQTKELRPLRMGFYQRDGLGGTPEQRLYNNWRFSFTDTSLYGLLEDIENAVSSIDFSGLSGLADLNVTVDNFYDSYINNQSVEIGLLESILDDDETDPDITRFNDEANVFKSEAAELHSIENDLYGTIADFTFPAIQDQSLTSSMFTEWLQDNLILTLLVVSLCFMLVFSFI